ncbi:MAG: hypothetical protein QM796_00075 [Chthoniobacteraceae bacterium]
MKRLLFLPLFLLTVICHAKPSIKDMPWPTCMCEFPAGNKLDFIAGQFAVQHCIPDDPTIQSEGGSGGPIVELTLRDHLSGWHTRFTVQSVGERLLEPWHGKPQIEVWARVGGGSWTRELYRYIEGEYQCVRIDDFEHLPKHQNEKAPTATLPDEFHGKAPPDGDPTLYFVKTRLPSL